ncbi:MAG: carbohydrate binding family 9 domain-containing protein, partial [Candidatus Latescibacteria bacterium]|nr:carbohydrate binding family 9 domain-containing protein [Candidatus Latescibacterota bacterium]
HEGEPAEEQTEVRILYDDRNLYISFRCFDAHPERIISRLLPRDGIAYPNDNVDFIIDTYHDHRNAYYFQVNAKGVKHDSWQRDSNWDGVWWCQTAMDDAGWSVEIGIPFKTLRFPHKELQTWGMNFARHRQAGNERSQWANARREFSVTTVYKAGDVVGFENLDPGVHLEILPYVTGRREQTTEDIERRFDGGANLKYGIAPNLTCDMAVNPDFAHVEADEEQINLSRFELYLKEKRPYFLENRKVFDTPIRLFYTRRIADPDFGMRLTGKIAGNDIALLQAVDRVEGSPNPNYTVFRLRREILRKSNIGLFSVNKDWNGGYARALGMDTHLALGEQFEIDAQWARSFNPDIHHDDWAGFLNIWKGTRNFEVYAEAEKT